MQMALPTNAHAAHLGQVVLDEAVGAQAHPPPGHGQRLAPGHHEPGLEPAAAPVGLQQHHHRQHHLGQEPCGATLVAIGHRLHQVASELDEGAHRRRAPRGARLRGAPRAGRAGAGGGQARGWGLARGGGPRSGDELVGAMRPGARVSAWADAAVLCVFLHLSWRRPVPLCPARAWGGRAFGFSGP